jgi:class 3 adenylate cyclase
MADHSQRRLAAILAADIAGYSVLMGADEARTVADLKGHQAVVLPMIGGHGGRVIDTAGDGILAEFQSIVNAAECAIAIQRAMAERNAGVEPARRMLFRIGLNLGDVIYDAARIYGDGINIAARLEAIAQPGGICISGKVHDEVHGKVSQQWEFLGEKELRNIAAPVRVYALASAGGQRAAAATATSASARRPGFFSRLFGRGKAGGPSEVPAAAAIASASEGAATAATASSAAPVIVHGQARAFCVLMGEDDTVTTTALQSVRQAVTATLREHGGQIIDSPPDTVAAAFPEAAVGVAGTIAALEGLLRMNQGTPLGTRVHYRFGIVTETAGAAASPETLSTTIAQAAALGFQAHTDGLVISEGVRSRLTMGGQQKFAMTGPGVYAYAHKPGPLDKGPAQLEALELPVPAGKPSIINGPFACIGDDPQGMALADGLRLDIQNCLTKMSTSSRVTQSSGEQHRWIGQGKRLRSLAIWLARPLRLHITRWTRTGAGRVSTSQLALATQKTRR